MAKDSKTAKQSKDKKKMATSNVTPVTETVKDPSKINGTVNKKVDNPFTGDEIVSTGQFELDAAQKIEDAYNLVGGEEKEVLFWFNYGRKVQAKQQMLGLLGFDLGSESLNELFKSFQTAMNNVLSKNASPERREAVRKFILSEEKFEPIREKLEAMASAGLEVVKVKFGTPCVPKVDENGKPIEVNNKVVLTVVEGETELRKPTGKKGRKAKVAVDPNAPVVPETSDSDEDDDDTPEE